MRALTTLLLFTLFVGSCQQRYAHVKKVKINAQGQAFNPFPYENLTTNGAITDSLIFSQTASSGHVSAEKIPEIVASPGTEKANSGDLLNRLPSVNKKSSKTEKNRLSRTVKVLDEPITFSEHLLIYSAFAVTFIVTSLIVVAMSFFGLWLSIALPYPSIVITVVTAGTVIVGWLYVAAYRKAERMIEDRIPDKTLGRNLTGHQILAILLTLAIIILAFVFASLPIAITLISVYLLAIFLYLFTYKKHGA